MNKPIKTDTSRTASGAQDTFFNNDDAIWLTNAAALELREKLTTAAAPTIRNKPRTSLDKPLADSSEPAHRPDVDHYGPTKIVHDVPSSQAQTASASARRKSPGSVFKRKPRVLTAPLAKRTAMDAKPKRDRSDLIVGAMGLALGLTCALFPWYIFFNQEKFGVREFVFSGEGGSGVATQLAYQPARIGQPFGEGEVPRMELDFFPTATLPAEGESGRAVPVSEQPFPADLVNYELVHVANGRAMIMDDTGLWVVQPGSQLPDASRVASIEKRDGRWVLVTTQDRVIKLER